MSYPTTIYKEDGITANIMLNRPDDGNMFNTTMCHEKRDACAHKCAPDANRFGS